MPDITIIVPMGSRTLFTPESGFSVSGNIADGNSITITGSSFGTKPHGVQPYMLIEFGANDSNPHSLSRGGWSHTWSANFTMQQTLVAPNRTHSMEYQFFQDNSGHGAINGDALDMGACILS